ncbi:uncharacterized protein L969DRAFT_94735 [Mixia osmundae IAM 14324]|uniref:Uncharacterized protein n=1 Tax=Mixia osmundae (strain CBS 9802 / IAM 14324 / JCM 22182 / KY 12970) TaxID=764103 RepID=G7E433_MIXOS|nr:uncharacterized protein L969DRAFT_94735 [Mixia osmundae IAM 14324]KEI39687.1 hypothetical protein L969DRAFT_94735 [Mixia osmundae IAM 14324]GAA97593.1 hypothetical protein E5Q_04271 [Mixia osmundae IAM 14324]
MRIVNFASTVLIMGFTSVCCSPVAKSTGDVRIAAAGSPQYYMSLSGYAGVWPTGFTFELAFDPAQSYYGALMLCNNDVKGSTCGAVYLGHGGTGDARWSDWRFFGPFYDLNAHLLHKADGTMTGWTLQRGSLHGRYIQNMALTNVQSHTPIPYLP